jgi:Transposase DDE domain.
MRVGGWLRIPDDSTFGRIFKEVNEEQIYLLETLNHRIRGAIWKAALRAGHSLVKTKRVLWIDVDSTVKTTYGEQEGAVKGYNPEKRGAVSYHPLIAFACETKEILQAWFRTGNAYTSNGIVEFMKQLLAHIPNRVRVVFRGDSGFFAGALLALLEDLGHGYLVKVKLRNLVSLMAKQVWSPVLDHPGWEQCEFLHECEGWGKARLFLALRIEKQDDEAQKRLLDVKVYDYFCYATTERLSPWSVHKKYGERATCETWIDEAKNQMGLGQIKTGEFLANAALFQCAVLAYNTVRWMALMSGNEDLRRWEMQTVRVFLVRVAGKLLTGSHQLTINTPKDHLYPKEWSDWVAVGL